MNKTIKVISPVENKLRIAIFEALTPFETEYIFDNNSGDFADRVISHFNSHIFAERNWQELGLAINGALTRLGTSLYIGLLGCKCKYDGLSIPCIVREGIKDEIIYKFIKLVM